MMYMWLSELGSCARCMWSLERMPSTMTVAWHPKLALPITILQSIRWAQGYLGVVDIHAAERDVLHEKFQILQRWHSVRLLGGLLAVAPQRCAVALQLGLQDAVLLQPPHLLHGDLQSAACQCAAAATSGPCNSLALAAVRMKHATLS